MTDKIKGTKEWLDQKLAELEIFKPKEIIIYSYTHLDVHYSDGAQYVKLLMNYVNDVNDVQNLHMKAQEEICKKIDIS
ncbi:unnamed protein product [Paramecium sonneborni]|uniref:Uncharacterized protein n=1 Tax=Paramecium sonneborni TaxID=65129 RepID=A0A8S1L5L5_9CILI|nr:unnamed protein product [Paramecium sonneborni]